MLYIFVYSVVHQRNIRLLIVLLTMELNQLVILTKLLLEVSFGCHGDIVAMTLLDLFTRQLIYFVIPVCDTDYIVVPPLQGFVMNRVSGDYFETLLYKVFVTINEHTQVSELANVLQINLQEVKVILLTCKVYLQTCIC